METIVSSELDYKKHNLLHPTYGFNKILPLSGSTASVATSTGGQEVLMEIPINAMNLANSFLSFQFNVPAVGVPTANGFNNVFKDCLPHFRQIQLYTRSGIYLCDLNEASNYTKVVWNAETKLSDFLQNDFMKGASGPPVLHSNSTPGIIGSGFHFHRSGDLKNGYTANSARPNIPGLFSSSPRVTFPLPAAYTAAAPQTLNIPLIPLIDVSILNALTIVPGQPTPASSNLDYTEPSYVYRSANELGGSESALTMNVVFPLKYLYNTIFALNKDVYFGEIVILRLVMQTNMKVAFINTTAGASILDLSSGALAIANDHPITYSNINLFVAVEKNPIIVNQLRTQIATTGLSLLIPYIYTYKNNLGSSTQTVSLRFNRGHGKSLLKIYHSIFNNLESSITTYDHNNINGLKCNTYYTMLNNNRLQEYNVDCTALDDYNLRRNGLKDKVLQTGNIFQYNWFHKENFAGIEDVDNLSTGLDLSLEQKWDFYGLIMGAPGNIFYNHYSFAVTQKTLTVSSNGITVM